ncbi:MAG: SseB family protein [Ornithinimicrobium sp.]
MAERFASHDPAHGDTGGTAWAGRALRPGDFDSDDGTADAELMAALAGPADEAELVAAVSRARLVVPIVAMPGPQATSEMAAVTLTSRGGRRALPAFTSTQVLVEWNGTARPVPVSAQRAAVAAAQEGCSELVLDPGSSWSVSLRASMVWALAEGRSWVPPHLDGAVRRAVERACRYEPSIEQWQTTPGPEGALVVELGLRRGLTGAALNEVVQHVGERIAEDEQARSRVDSVSFRLTAIS